jgi:hypothetical protein
MESIVIALSITLQACRMVAKYLVPSSRYLSIVPLVSLALQACSLIVVKYSVALRPYLSLTGEAAVLPSCYIPHSNKLSFAVVEAVFACASSPRVIVSFGVVILVLLTFMKPTVNTLVSTNHRSPWLVQLKNPLKFKLNICPKGNVTRVLLSVSRFVSDWSCFASISYGLSLGLSSFILSYFPHACCLAVVM